MCKRGGTLVLRGIKEKMISAMETKVRKITKTTGKREIAGKSVKRKIVIPAGLKTGPRRSYGQGGRKKGNVVSARGEEALSRKK